MPKRRSPAGSPPEKKPHVSGFVSILGLPNAGKSTLLNALVGTKLAIVADKPQTTRTSVQGVLTLPDAQIVFLDTPGIHKSDSLFNRKMMQTVRAAVDDRDLLLFLVDVSRPHSNEEERALDLVRKGEAPVFLLLNKIDKVKDKRKILPRIEQLRALLDFAEYIPISAATGDGLEELVQAMIAVLPESPPLFPGDYLTDQPERFLAAEIIREKVLELTRQEVPHAVAVLVETWEGTGNLLRIAATVYVEREGQKAIIIGSKGAMLKEVGTLARQELESFFGRKVFLELFVKVWPAWRNSPEFLNAIDWRSMAGTESE